MLGAAATLSCTFVGKPTNQVVWYRKGKRVEPSDTVRIRSTDAGSELTIRGVSAAHTGQYTVSIRNPYGEDFASATLAVPGKFLQIFCIYVSNAVCKSNVLCPVCPL